MLSGLVNKLVEYLRLLLFMAAVLIGVQAPGFIQQYENTLAAHLAEAKRSVTPFMQDANLHTNGDIHALIERYQQNQDAAVRDGGDNIEELLQRVEYLERMLEQLSTNALQRGYYALLQPDPELFSEVSAAYDYRVPLNATAIIWGLCCGIVLAGLFDLFIGLFLWMLPTRQKV